MGDFLNLKTMNIEKSLNTPDFINNFDYAPIKVKVSVGTSKTYLTTALPSCDKKYWKRSGKQVLEMTTAEKAVVDNAEQDAVKLQECEILIQAKIREMAIKELEKEGKL